ncbi:FecR protein [uncultured Caudovirales phage]|uniref:FecR protein n=1 Tax=uncultured Caudovirales phage TaxID=2100421 RepID=A0A6J5PLU8_9CAUD|nr:FecR protein [uncultured Caudovirales phage]CAB4181392.1 FecR protein [uncultured Caudovirales phage]CAB4198430.1 FecR protein [uncultured Caudovirales phage]CAB4211423.1 FecR protein [uncultured Caudovirales phage]CAB5238499.1 FecR protein [uncultured Caudovirales phage]
MKYLILCFVLLPTIGFSAVGKITEQVNAVPSIQRNKETISGAKGTGVEMNDAIKTTRGKVGITFADDTKVEINENSRLVIDDFVYDPKAKTGKLAMKVALGTVRYASGQIAHNNNQNVNINTPTATVAVRGTDFTATVDEVGASTIILLPTCPGNKIPVDVLKDCYTGIIDVITDGGVVTLTRPFEATKVYDRSLAPMKPVILNLLNFDMLNNMLIVSPPQEIKKEEDKQKSSRVNVLSVDFLKENSLVNALDTQQKQLYEDKLSRNLLDQNFLANVLDIINAQMAAQLDLLNNSKSGLLPDYVATSGVIAEVDDVSVTLFRNDGSNTQSVTVPKNQNSTIKQLQGSVEITNRVNSGGSTVIILRQN